MSSALGRPALTMTVPVGRCQPVMGGRRAATAVIDGAKQHEVRFSSGFEGRAFHALTEIGALIEAGRFWLPVDRTYPLAEISEAHCVSEYGQVRGRLVLVIG
jgi:NADPH:quinone reductase-like Zn-dependent oxidoreductase